MYLVISKCVTAVKVSHFSGHYLRNRSNLDMGVLSYIGIFITKGTFCRSLAHSSWDTLYIYIYIHTHKHTHTHIYQTEVYIHTCVCVYIYIYIHTYIYQTGLCVFVYIYIYIHTYTYIYQTEVYAWGYTRTNVIGFRTSFVIASVRSGIHWTICI